MVYILAILSSPRRNGGTYKLLKHIVDTISKNKNVNVELIRLIDYKIEPCKACFNCIKDPKHTCILNDDLGKKGKGILYKKISNCDGFIIADAVHKWGPTSLCHLFFERLYPFTWSGFLKGKPLVSISCASNQGFQVYAMKEICKWAFTSGLKYIGGLAIHYAYYEEAKEEIEKLGKKLLEEVLKKKREKNKRWTFEKEKNLWLYYIDKPWSPLEPYIENLTRGSFKLEKSIPYEALSKKKFKNKEAINHLRKTVEHLKKTLEYYKEKNMEAAIIELAKVSSYWAHATWKEFVEALVVNIEIPSIYKPLPD